MEILCDGRVEGIASVSEQNWTFETIFGSWDFYPHPNYTANFTARVVGSDGAVCGESAAYVVNFDIECPTQGVTIENIDINMESEVLQAPPVLQGTLSAALETGDVVAVYRDGIKVGTATINGKTWSFTDTGSLSLETLYHYTARVVDLAGNEGPPSDAYDMKLGGNPAPHSYDIAITAFIDEAAPVKGVVASGGWTNDTSHRLHGTLSAPLQEGDKVEILYGGHVSATAEVSGQTWSYKSTDPVWAFVMYDTPFNPDATITFSARIVDSSGNILAASNPYVIHFDRYAPEQTVTINQIFVITDGSSYDSMIEGTLSERLGSGQFVAIYRDGVKVGTAMAHGISWNFLDSDADHRAENYTARVEDRAGNEGPMSDLHSTDLILAVADKLSPFAVSEICNTMASEPIDGLNAGQQDHGSDMPVTSNIAALRSQTSSMETPGVIGIKDSVLSGEVDISLSPEDLMPVAPYAVDEINILALLDDDQTIANDATIAAAGGGAEFEFTTQAMLENVNASLQEWLSTPQLDTI